MAKIKMSGTKVPPAEFIVSGYVSLHKPEKAKSPII
jgi:hypothetical protein